MSDWQRIDRAKNGIGFAVGFLLAFPLGWIADKFHAIRLYFVAVVLILGNAVVSYFAIRGTAHSGDLDDLAKDTGQDMVGEGTQVTARLDAAANVRAGAQAELWVNTAKMHVFDIESGANLTSGEAAGVSA